MPHALESYDFNQDHSRVYEEQRQLKEEYLHKVERVIMAMVDDMKFLKKAALESAEARQILKDEKANILIICHYFETVMKGAGIL
jgi:hypothetical protein